MAQVRCRDASGSTGLFEDIHRTLENTGGRSEGALALERRMLTPSQRRPVLSQRRRARVRRGRVAEQDASGASGRRLESSRADGARRERARLSRPRPRTRAPARRGEGGPSARAPCPSLQEMTAGKARLRNTPRAVRARRRADRSVLPPPSARAPRRASTVPVRRRARKSPRKFLDPTRSDPSTPSTRRRPAVDPPSRHLTSRLPRSSRAVRDDARHDPRHGGSPRRQG